MNEEDNHSHDEEGSYHADVISQGVQQYVRAMKGMGEVSKPFRMSWTCRDVVDQRENGES